MNGYRTDRRWSDAFLGSVARILTLRFDAEFVRIAAQDDDNFRNTDLDVFASGRLRIACRIRRHEYQSRFGAQFTLRSTRPDGRQTELDKLLAGWGEYFFYGFAKESEDALSSWHIGDLSVFRDWFRLRVGMNNGTGPGTEMENSDGSSKFRAFYWANLPRAFIIASCEPTA